MIHAKFTKKEKERDRVETSKSTTMKTRVLSIFFTPYTMSCVRRTASWSLCFSCWTAFYQKTDLYLKWNLIGYSFFASLITWFSTKKTVSMLSPRGGYVFKEGIIYNPPPPSYNEFFLYVFLMMKWIENFYIVQETLQE